MQTLGKVQWPNNANSSDTSTSEGDLVGFVSDNTEFADAIIIVGGKFVQIPINQLTVIEDDGTLLLG